MYLQYFKSYCKLFTTTFKESKPISDNLKFPDLLKNADYEDVFNQRQLELKQSF